MQVVEDGEIWDEGIHCTGGCGIPRLWDSQLSCCGGKKVGGGKLRLRFVTFINVILPEIEFVFLFKIH